MAEIMMAAVGGNAGYCNRARLCQTATLAAGKLSRKEKRRKGRAPLPFNENRIILDPTRGPTQPVAPVKHDRISYDLDRL